MFQQSSFAVSEYSLLNGIGAKYQQIASYMHTCPVNPTQQWLNGLDQLIGELRAYAPQAAILSSQGRPQAQQDLNAALADLQRARETYAEMVQSVMQTQWNNWRIWRDANTYATATIMDATNHSNGAFARSMQGYFDVAENRCYDCHCLINIPGGGYCLECARRRGLIW